MAAPGEFRAETGGELTSFLRRPLAAKWETGCKVVGGESREPREDGIVIGQVGMVETGPGWVLWSQAERGADGIGRGIGCGCVGKTGI